FKYRKNINKKRTWIFHVRLSRGSGGGTRTPDKVVNSHLLYQLSYSGITAFTLKKRANLG
ncbi:uncharacterized protein METZ01_LOCUS109020, partial [marine metagenome]